MNKIFHWVVPFLIAGNSWVTVTPYDNTCHAKHHYVAQFVVINNTQVILWYDQFGTTEILRGDVDVLDISKYNEVETEVDGFKHNLKWKDGKVEVREEGKCGHAPGRHEPKMR